MLFSRVNVSENNLKHTFLFTQIQVPFGLIKKRFETFNVIPCILNPLRSSFWLSIDKNEIVSIPFLFSSAMTLMLNPVLVDSISVK